PAKEIACGQYQDESRKYALDPPGIEFGEAKRSLVQILKNDRRYKISGNDKKDVNTYEPPAYLAGIGVESDDGENRHRSQAVDVGAVLRTQQVRLRGQHADVESPLDTRPRAIQEKAIARTVNGPHEPISADRQLRRG